MNKEQLTEMFKKQWTFPHSRIIKDAIESFSIAEKVFFYIFVGIFILSGISLLYQVNREFLVEVPDYGGSFTEGIVGAPRFINPILALSDADRDVTTLVYSGLLKATPEGTLIPDLASDYVISDDGLIYTFTIRPNAVFQDGTPVTADDVEFTILKAQDPNLKSPRRSNWDGVKVTKIDEHTISFTLKQAYSPFIQNTTLGILPKHLWKNVDVESFPFSTLNSKPIGSGPYTVSSVQTNSAGLPETYTLTAFKKYMLGRPYISTITLHFYSNEKEALKGYNNGDVDALGSISPEYVKTITRKDGSLNTTILPRVFGVFFNQNQNKVFTYKEVRQALDMSLNKKEIVDSVLFGYGQEITGPLPASKTTLPTDTTRAEGAIESARALLEKNGWKLNSSGIYEKKDKNETIPLSFSISTSDAPELKASALLMQQTWQKLGAVVEVKIFEIGDLNQNIIRPRKYDALFFGTIIGRDLDLYPFWHSSQRNDPGLNIALYTNSQADKLLETFRKTTDEGKKADLLESIEKEITADTPALFIYSPYFIYEVPSDIKNVTLHQLTTSADRFIDIEHWYIETNNVWKIFIKK